VETKARHGSYATNVMKNSKKIYKCKIRGRRWTIRVAKPPIKGHAEGLCDYGTRTIYLKPKTELPATLVHEVLHACFPDISEDAICAAETAIMESLIACDLVTPDESNT
jgi:hypothetical protein